MPTYFSAPFTAPGTSAVVYLQLDTAVASQDIVANTSTLAYTLYHYKPAAGGSPFRSSNDSGASVFLGSPIYSASNLNYNLTGSGVWVISSDTTVVTHAADGTLTVGVGAGYDGKTPLGTASISTTWTLPAIPRNRMRVGVAGAWVQHEVFVGVNGEWKMAQPHAGVVGAWKALDNA